MSGVSAVFAGTPFRRRAWVLVAEHLSAWILILLDAAAGHGNRRSFLHAANVAHLDVWHSIEVGGQRDTIIVHEPFRDFRYG